MKRHNLMLKILFISALLLGSCGRNFSEKSKEINSSSLIQDSIKSKNTFQDTTYVKKWLTKVILDYVNSDASKVADSNLRSAMTEDYYNYKLNAITSEYSGMTKEEFNEKWKMKFNTKYVGNAGFFSAPQDHGKISVPVCSYIKSSGDSVGVFHVVIHDMQWKTDNNLDITTIVRNQKLLIGDVKEYD
jgi:hypothetical protein